MPVGRLALLIATVAVLSLLGYAILVDPIGLCAIVVALFSYIAIVTTGVLVPRLEMFGPVMWRGPHNSRAVALTFDDGPHPETTRQVLRILADRGAVATFFVVGDKVDAYPDVVREIAAAGHEIGTHGQTHRRLYSFLAPSAVEADLGRARAGIAAAGGGEVRWFRPPIGHVSPRTAAGARRANLPIVAWSVKGRDGVGRARPAAVARRIERGLHGGAIVLMHDAAEREDHVPASIEALPSVLDAIERRGLEMVTVGRLLG